METQINSNNQTEAVQQVLLAMGFTRHPSYQLFTLKHEDGIVRIPFQEAITFCKASRVTGAIYFQKEPLSDYTRKLHLDVSQKLIKAARLWLNSQPESYQQSTTQIRGN